MRMMMTMLATTFPIRDLETSQDILKKQGWLKNHWCQSRKCSSVKILNTWKSLTNRGVLFPPPLIRPKHLKCPWESLEMAVRIPVSGAAQLFIHCGFWCLSTMDGHRRRWCHRFLCFLCWLLWIWCLRSYLWGIWWILGVICRRWGSPSSFSTQALRSSLP